MTKESGFRTVPILQFGQSPTERSPYDHFARRRDADSRTPSQSSLPSKAATSIMSISIIENWPSECYGYARSTIDTVSAQPTEHPLFLFR